MIPAHKYTTNDFLINNLVFVQADDSVSKVYQLMQRERVRHVPVLEKGEAIGVISDRDVKFVSYSSGVVEMTAKDIMTEEPFTVQEGTHLRDMVFTMWEKKIGSCLINNKEGKVIGIFTSTDALRVLTESISEPDNLN